MSTKTCTLTSLSPLALSMGPSVLLKSPGFVITLLLYLSSVAYSVWVRRNNNQVFSLKEVNSDGFVSFFRLLLIFVTVFSTEPPPETIKFFREITAKAEQSPEFYQLYTAVRFYCQGLILFVGTKDSISAWAIAACVMAALCPSPVNFVSTCMFYGLLFFFVGIMVLKVCVYMDMYRFGGPSKLSTVLEISDASIKPVGIMLVWISAPSFSLPSFEMPGRIGELILGYAKRVSQDRMLYPLLTVVIGICLGLIGSLWYSGFAWMYAANYVALTCPPPINTVSSCIYYGAWVFFALMTSFSSVLRDCKHFNQLRLHLSGAFFLFAASLVSSFIVSIMSSRFGWTQRYINYESSKPSA